MNKRFAALAIMICVASTTPSFARESNHGNNSGYHPQHYNRQPSYGRSGGHGGRHHNDGLGVAFGVVGGLLLGSALLYSATQPPPAVAYSAPYPPEVVVQQPRICIQDRVVNGQWQIDPYNGRRIWMPFAYPVTQRVQVPCY